jgi:hypothetical protein
LRGLFEGLQAETETFIKNERAEVRATLSLEAPEVESRKWIMSSSCSVDGCEVQDASYMLRAKFPTKEDAVTLAGKQFEISVPICETHGKIWKASGSTTMKVEPLNPEG